MSRKDIDPQGAQNLVQAIVRQARVDVLNNKPGTPARRSAEVFFRSAWFETLTGFNGKPVLKKLQAIYDKRHPKKKVVAKA